MIDSLNVFAEYVWLDQNGGLRSKTRKLTIPEKTVKITNSGVQVRVYVSPKEQMLDLPTGFSLDVDVENAFFPRWSFDGSSTGQAEAASSDLFLIPVYVVQCPIYHNGGFIVLCEVFNQDMTPHESNTRAKLRKVLDAGAKEHNPWFGFEQEYFFMQNGRPLGFPENPDHWPTSQGEYYCGINYGIELYEKHLEVCDASGLSLFGGNPEVAPGQWEFQLGPLPEETRGRAFALEAADQLWISRWILNYIALKAGCRVNVEPKPVKGDWNGNGMHTNFSIERFRQEGGVKLMRQFFQTLQERHMEHIEEYGADNNQRLTGTHETSPIDKFSAGVADRTVSVRIPLGVEKTGYGYFEDRRPAGNGDPYRIETIMLETVLTFMAKEPVEQTVA